MTARVGLRKVKLRGPLEFRRSQRACLNSLHRCRLPAHIVDFSLPSSVKKQKSESRPLGRETRQVASTAPLPSRLGPTFSCSVASAKPAWEAPLKISLIKYQGGRRGGVLRLLVPFPAGHLPAPPSKGELNFHPS